jgi:hypothetical protein
VHFARDVRDDCAMTRSIVQQQFFGGVTIMQSKLSFFIRSHSELAPVFIALTLLAFVSVGCSSEPCPEGTKQDGEVCRRISSMRNASGTAGSTGSDDEDVADAAVGEPKLTGKAGSGGSVADASVADESDESEESASGRGGSGGTKAGAGGGGAGGKGGAGGAGAGGKGGSSGAASGGAGGKSGAGGAGGAGAGGKGGTGGAGAGGAGAAGSTAGAGGASGAGGKAGAGGAAGSTAGAGGAGGSAGATDPMFPPGPWFCVNIGASCTCIPADGEASDTCADPKPKCCFSDKSEDSPNCQCWPEDSRECKEDGVGPDVVKVDACPPAAK